MSTWCAAVAGTTMMLCVAAFGYAYFEHRHWILQAAAANTSWPCLPAGPLGWMRCPCLNQR